MGAGGVGGYVGARIGRRLPDAVFRVFFLVVVSACVVRIGGSVVGLW